MKRFDWWPDQSIRTDKSGGFSKRKTKWSRRKGRRSWSIMLTPCTGRSLAVLLHLSSATGNASRRIADGLPVRSIAANSFLAGRSLAAYCPPWPVCAASRPAFPRSPERDQRERRNFCEPFEPREERSDEVRAGLAFIGARPVSSGLVRFDDFEMQWNGGGIFVAAMERNGEAANWRVRPGRERKRAEPDRATGGVCAVPERKDGEAR